MSVRRALPALMALAMLGVALVLAAGPASAHADLVGSDPASGSRLEQAPAEVTLTFTEDVDLLDGGLRLVDGDGEEVATPDASADGRTVRWPMPDDLPEGAYLATWRVISSDSHPVAGVVSFGVGVDPGEAPSGAEEAAGTAPWPVVAARFLGYAALALVLGALALLLLAPTAAQQRDGTRPQPKGLLLGLAVGVVTGLVATVAGLLLQGPYVAGLPMREVLDPSLLSLTGHNEFGASMQIRALLYLMLAGVVWGDRLVETQLTRWLVIGGGVGLAATFPATGHAAASGRFWDLLVDGVHVLAAGTWVGGLVLLALTLHPRRGMDPVVPRFSRLALGLVVLLVATGTLNAVVHLDALEELWQSRYGVTLLVKLGVVVVALTAAGASRRLTHDDRSPWRPVRLEAAATSVVLLVTAVLAMTPTPTATTPATPPDGGSSWLEQQEQSGTVVEMDLGDGRFAELHVAGLRPGGSILHVELHEPDGSPMDARRVELKLELPAEDLGPFVVPVRRDATGWLGTFSFALPGTWTATLTVEDLSQAGIVTTGEITIVE